MLVCLWMIPGRSGCLGIRLLQTSTVNKPKPFLLKAMLEVLECIEVFQGSQNKIRAAHHHINYRHTHNRK